MRMKMSIVICVAFAFDILVGTIAFGFQSTSDVDPIQDQAFIADAPGPLAEPKLENQDTSLEYDNWRGSSMGARLEVQKDGFYVAKVLPHVDDSPLKNGDRILAIGTIDASEVATFLRDLRKYLAVTAPATTLNIRLVRDDQEQVVELKTYRREFVDIARLVERINANRIIKNHLADLERLDELNSMTEKMVTAVRASQSPREAFEGINTVIDELGISHSAFVPGSTYGQLRGSAGEIGLALRRYNVNGETGYFVIDKKPGTAIHKSNILLGDRILFVNGVAIEASRRLVLAGEEQRYEVFGIDAKPGETVRFEYQHCPGSPLLTERVKAHETLSLEDSVNASSKVIDYDGQSFGYLRFWNLMSIKSNTALRSNLKTTFADCDAIVLDLRGRGGVITAVNAIEKTVRQEAKPVIAITDELTRSAKEILSFKLKKLDNVTVIGEQTAGAVTACNFYKLPSGNVFMYPVMSSDALKRYTDGVILEGNGVEADLPVNFFEAYCYGSDKLLDFAVQTASRVSRASASAGVSPVSGEKTKQAVDSADNGEIVGNQDATDSNPGR